VAIAHDYLTQLGGAERVVLAMIRALPGAPVYTSLYDPAGTFPEFGSCDVRTGLLDRIGPLRRHHRLALPLLAPSFSSLRVDAEVLLCSTSGWAHGAHCTGAKVVYCYTPARWLYQTERYLGTRRRSLAEGALSLLRPPLRRWDRRAAATASRYIAISSVVRDRIRRCYGVDAEILHPPHSLNRKGAQSAVPGLDEGYLLCVSRLLPYKNVGALMTAVAAMPGRELVVVGSGPQATSLRAAAPSHIRMLGSVDDDRLRWLYAHCSAVVAPSYEDFGLVPLEAATFGKPAVALRWGGFLDTVVEGRSGVFFDHPAPTEIAAAISEADAATWSPRAIQAIAQRFSEVRFRTRLCEVVAEEAKGA
jgi:glycosyltransferase involved in cell wall biosynthesis